MMNKIVLSLAISAVAATSAFAGQPVVDHKAHKPIVAPETCFQDTELQLDLFASYTNAVHRSDHGDGFGGGLGVNYFFMRNIGVGVDGNVYDGDSDLVWESTARVIVRFPIDSACLAPYIFGGGGVQADDNTSSGTLHAGGGLEWRATQSVGFFGEGRYTWSAHENNGAQVRIGARFVF